MFLKNSLFELEIYILMVKYIGVSNLMGNSSQHGIKKRKNHGRVTTTTGIPGRDAKNMDCG